MKSRFTFFSLLTFFSFVHLASAEDVKEGPPKPNKYRKSRLTNDESEETADKRFLLLSTGEDKAVDLDFEANAGANGISYGNPQLVTTTLVKIGDKRQIIFKPLKAGDTTVTIRDNDGTLRLIFKVRVTASNLLRVAGEIRSLLRDVEGAETRIVGQKIVIEGELLVPSDYGRLLTVIQDKNYADYILNLTTLSALSIQVLAKRMQADINNFAPNVTTRVVNGIVFLEGNVNTIDDMKHVLNLATAYLPELRPGNSLERDPSAQRVATRSLISNFIIVNPPPQRKQEKLVKVTVHFVELSKDYNKLFAFAWKPGFTADPQFSIGQSSTGTVGTTGAAAGTSFTATLSSLLPKLTNSQTAGYARVLNTGTIIVRSGQAAKLQEQTTYPYTQTGSNGQAVSASANVGLTVAVTPVILGNSDDIQLDVELDQTDLVGNPPTSGGAAVTDSHKVNTKIYVKSNESAAVAGLDESNVGTDFNKDDPNSGSTFSANTDPLFNLIHSKNFRKKRTQFVVFLTPQIIDSASEGTDELRKSFRIKVK